MNAQSPVIENQEIEGLGNTDETGWGDYPIDTILIRTESRTIFDVVRRIEQGSFVMNPDFQREFIWKKDKQSKLIESVMMRIPLPVFYLAENEQGQMVVVDGLQRLSTFRDFYHNKLRLKLPEQVKLDKKHFTDLSPKLQNRFEDCNLVLYIIDAKVPDRAMLDIFERVNGGVALSRQQMRNCLYMGKATRFLKQEAETELFLKATGNSLRTDDMRDREFVNRFVSFYLLPLDDYKRNMDDFLALGLKKLNRGSDAELDLLSTNFQRSLLNNYKLFGQHAFRKHSIGQQTRGVINASLWDVMSTGLASYSENDIQDRAVELRGAFYSLMENEEFINSVTYTVTGTKQVKKRFEIATAMLKEVFRAETT